MVLVNKPMLIGRANHSWLDQLFPPLTLYVVPQVHNIPVTD